MELVRGRWVGGVSVGGSSLRSPEGQELLFVVCTDDAGWVKRQVSVY